MHRNRGDALQIFENKTFGQIRTLEENGRILFCGTDVAKALAYAKPNNAISRHCRYTLKRGIPHPQSPEKIIDMVFISEGDVYRLAAHSRLQASEAFEAWIFDIVLPTIRRTGGFVSDEEQFVENYLPFADEPIKALFRLQLQTIRQLNGRIEKEQPLVDFAHQVTDTDGTVSIGELAKLAAEKGLPIGQNRLFRWLRQKKILMRSNKPYQRYIDRGYFEVIDTVLHIEDRRELYLQPRVTGKGQIYLMGRLKREYWEE
ncbi:MAG: phage antirepressor KilAC domain-containing protein [Oscillospiraceae bacterium]|nr:phage antirepressor KilAC domain-containing protein [Oscillospiraceae bacterium]